GVSLDTLTQLQHHEIDGAADPILAVFFQRGINDLPGWSHAIARRPGTGVTGVVLEPFRLYRGRSGEIAQTSQHQECHLQCCPTGGIHLRGPSCSSFRVASYRLSPLPASNVNVCCVLSSSRILHPGGTTSRKGTESISQRYKAPKMAPR